MSKRHPISWVNVPGYTGETWNPIVGCSPLSKGCEHCYAARLASTRLKHVSKYRDLAKEGKWTGEVRLWPNAITEPLHWQKPRAIFVCDMGDLFHPNVRIQDIECVYSVMRRCPQHLFMVLTKRPDRMYVWSETPVLPNVWIGTTVESQEYVDRIATLLRIPAAKHFVSVEPMLGEIDLDDYLAGYGSGDHLDWVICGGESGPKARPIDPDWVRSLRDQCIEAKVPFHFKQWGSFGNGPTMVTWINNETWYEFPCIDDEVWHEFPKE